MNKMEDTRNEKLLINIQDAHFEISSVLGAISVITIPDSDRILTSNNLNVNSLLHAFE